MTEVVFYHLTEMKLEQALPDLLERSLGRGWKVIVQTISQDRCDALDEHLWTFKEDSFLPHAAQGKNGVESQSQPIWITTSTANENSAQVRFLVDNAVPGTIDEYERAIYMFDGHDEDAVTGARERWKIDKAAGHSLTYWQQEDGKWVKKAQS